MSTRVRIEREVLEQAKKFVEEHPEAGYESVDDLVVEALERFLKKMEASGAT